MSSGAVGGATAVAPSTSNTGSSFGLVVTPSMNVA
jgi:hypothetical protein